MLKLNIYIYINISNFRVAVKRIVRATKTKTKTNYALINSHRGFNWLVNRRSQNLNNKLFNFLRINTLLVNAMLYE